MPAHQPLEHEQQLNELADRVRGQGLPLPPRPSATMALAVAVHDALQGAGSPSPAGDAAQLAADVFDKTMQSVPADQLGEVACKSGCTYCCHNVVMATAPEIFWAARELRAGRDAEQVAAVAARCATARATADAGRKPCPLLSEDLCSVYAARPSVCRKHTSFSVEACLSDHEGRGGQVPIRQIDQVVFECCAVALLLGMRLSGRKAEVFELSAALAVALQDPQAERRWLAGEDVFAGVPSQGYLPGIDQHAQFIWTRFVRG
jgi:Fe-S-cluster containining protein